MECPVCFTEFKNYNSYRVHKWRFHNPTTKYGTKETSTLAAQTPSRAKPTAASLLLPMATASVAIAGSKGDWKKWALLILISAAIGFAIWYYFFRTTNEKDHLGAR